MNEYEVIIEVIDPCVGRERSTSEMIEVAAESPEAYVKANGKFPITDIVTQDDGTVVVHTADGLGNMANYTFNKI